MTFGEPGTWSARVHDLKDVEAILDAFRAHGHTEVRSYAEFCNSQCSPSVYQIDTARVYSGGTSEEYLGKIDWEGKGLKLETKLYPTIVGASGVTGANFPQFLKQLEGRTSGISSATATDPVTHTPEGLRKHLLQSLKALNAESLETWYLHAPDRTVPYEVTLKAVDNLYKEGYFKRFGISNYAA
ncbi:hypothetical protein DXG03_007274 [Asterophora parasitica]|uniref:NADP-dependent oxidoreductase domain-containing protein n=1 Tax=Asterophora parasitica TaxID=117018 RepID=A0A9P7GDH2_9AGAR|nr:hypothetical protein DXG03_007274 [Asterophora parasitica]